MKEVYKRRAYHNGFNGMNKISEDDINSILKAGMNAPTAMNTKAWEFVVVDDHDKLQHLASATRGTHACATASHVIVICVRPDDYAGLNTGIAAENLILEATHLGIGSLIMGIHHDEAAQTLVKETLKIPSDYTAELMIAFGYPTETLPPNDYWLPEKIHHNEF